MFTIKRAAEITGIPEATLRAWERRYGIVQPARSTGGYRMYDADAIARLRTMQRKVAEGFSPAQAAAAALAAVSGTSDEPALDSADSAQWTTRFFEAVSTFDESALTQVLDSAFSSASFEHVVDGWLAPTLHSLGERWLAGTIDIAGEHFASHAIMRKLSGAYEAAGASASGPGVIIGSPSGSLHEIGSLAFATAARRRGLRSVYLGADVPEESWVAAAGREGTRAVVITVTTADDVDTARTCVARLHQERALLPVFVGGPWAHAVGGEVHQLTGGIGQCAMQVAAYVV